MLASRLYETAGDLPQGFSVESLPGRKAFGRVLMGRPEHFDVVCAINPHMMEPDGALRQPDRALAREQWECLRRTWEALGYAVSVLPAVEGWPDLVFVSDLAVIFPRGGGDPHRALVSRMRHDVRAGEPELVEPLLTDLGFEILRLPPDSGLPLEGHGDLSWFSGKRLLLGGHGFRTGLKALAEVAERGRVPVLALRLVNPVYYHLGACFMPLDEERAGWVPEAFDEEGRRLLQSTVPRLIEVPPQEAAQRLAGNAACVDGRNVIIDAGCTETIALLEQEGFSVHPVDTSEFLKAGGSVSCMTLMLPSD